MSRAPGSFHSRTMTTGALLINSHISPDSLTTKEEVYITVAIFLNILRNTSGTSALQPIAAIMQHFRAGDKKHTLKYPTEIAALHWNTSPHSLAVDTYSRKTHTFTHRKKLWPPREKCEAAVRAAMLCPEATQCCKSASLIKNLNKTFQQNRATNPQTRWACGD